MAKRINSLKARTNWRELLDSVDQVDILIERYGRPVAAMIPFEDYEAIQDKLEDLRAVRQATADYREARQSTLVEQRDLVAEVEKLRSEVEGLQADVRELRVVATQASETSTRVGEAAHSE